MLCHVYKKQKERNLEEIVKGAMRARAVLL